MTCFRKYTSILGHIAEEFSENVERDPKILTFTIISYRKVQEPIVDQKVGTYFIF
jgi:hypothetical protein